MSDRICTVEGCIKTRRGARYCSAHESRLKRNGTLGDTPVGLYRYPKQQCSLPDCDADARALSGMCDKHRTRVRRHGDPNYVVPPPMEEQHFRWKAEAVGIQGAHQRVITRRGKAAQHQCVTCHNQAHSWAYDHQDPDEKCSPQGWPYSVNPDHYQPMCWSCHKRFDLDHIKRAALGRETIAS